MQRLKEWNSSMMTTNALAVDWKSATVETTERLFMGQSQDLHETGENRR